MNNFLTPKVNVVPKPLERVYTIRFVSRARGLNPYTPGVRVAMFDSDSNASLHRIERTDTMFNEHGVDDVRIKSNIINASVLWLAPDDDGKWDLKSVQVSCEDDHVPSMFEVNAVFSEGIQITRSPLDVTADDFTLVRNHEYAKFQKSSMDIQWTISCALTVGCILINPSYAVRFILSSTVGTIYLYLLEKQVASLGTSPFATLFAYQSRMVLVNGFLIYSFTEYSKTNDISYLIVSAIGFFIYRITLVISSQIRY
jgi:hypothetical protein